MGLNQKGVFTPFEKGMLGAKEYKRVIPSRFEGDGDDIFMRSVFTNYALEGKDDDGNPTGVFTLDETQAKALVTEVLCTHKSSVVPSLLDTWLLTGVRHGDTSMSTRADPLKPSKLPNLSDSSHPINT